MNIHFIFIIHIFHIFADTKYRLISFFIIFYIKNAKFSLLIRHTWFSITYAYGIFNNSASLFLSKNML